MFLRDYVIIKKSTLLVTLALAAAGCLLYRRYSQPGNDLGQDADALMDKGKRKAKAVAEAVKS